MSFNSIEFALFLPIVFLIYWALKKHLTTQNLFIVAISYIFYGWWDWRFLFLIFITSFSTYITALYIHDKHGTRHRLWLIVNIVFNLLILIVFKYFNFFGENLTLLFRTFGIQLDWFTIEILLPVGISFYTFQAISYSIDVYRGNISATRNILAFFAYISFFPQLVAGPIEKAKNLLPQFFKNREFDYDNAVIGMRQILWGLVKKVVIADNCAHYVDLIWSNPDYYNSSTLLLSAILFSFQIYGDFSGYSDIAIGSARLFGIQLRPNFNYPYFSRNLREFWQNWHISLMSWLRDYVYIPLGGSHKGKTRTIINIAIVFFISGLWHGANWTFVAWGLFNGLILITLHLMRVPKSTGIPSLRDIASMIGTFALFTTSWIIFRATTIAEFWHYFTSLFTLSIFEMPTGLSPIPYITIFMIIEWFGRKNEFAIKELPFKSHIARWSFYWILLFAIVFATSFESQQFIYFQF